MQLLTFLPALLFTTLTIAGNDQVALKPTTQDLKVPGKNPLTFCEAPDNYILNLDNVDLDPNPPQAYAQSSFITTPRYSLKPPVYSL